MTKSKLNQLQTGNPVRGFVWPSPPYFDLPANDPASAPEQCVIDLLNGTHLSGRLLRVLPDETLVEIRSEQAPKNQTIDFAAFRRLTLPRPMAIRKHEGLPGTAAGVYLPDEKFQSFVIDYHNGETFVGETAGFVSESHGLFLFMPDTEDTVLRCFIPQAALEDFRIGDLIGSILVAKKIASAAQIDTALEEQRKLRAQKLGELLTEKQVVTPEQLSASIRHTSTRPILKLGEALTELGLLTETELHDALEQQKGQRRKPLGELLIEMGAVDRDTVRMVMAHKIGIPFVNLREFKVQRDVLPLVPASMVWRHGILPIHKTDRELVIAMSDPTSMPFATELRFLTGLQIVPAIAEEQVLKECIRQSYGEKTEPVTNAKAIETSTLESDNLAFYNSALKESIHRRYGANAEPGFQTVEMDGSKDKTDDPVFYRSTALDPSADDLVAQLEAADTRLEVVENYVNESDTTLIQFINTMILDAHAQQASGIHLETYPGRKNIRIRFRKDGIMADYMELPPKFRNAILPRIKTMSQIDVSDRRRPQDGRIDFKRFGPAQVELRVSTIPTANGLEDVVMSILAPMNAIPIDDLGLETKELAELKQLLLKPLGLVLVCGPEGSGKTTTLHAALSCINTPARKIWTAEDPLEITQEGLRQVQVDPRIGWTFAEALRSFLRLDPDVIMVGEMQDQETVKIGLEAALTGHLVLSALRADNAAEGVVRLLDVGADPFQAADALLGVLAQRFARRLCPACRMPHAPSADDLRALAQEYCQGTSLDPDAEAERWRDSGGAKNRQLTLYAAKGCGECGHSGYKGRLGIHELLVAQPAIKRQIRSKASAGDILDAALAAGMRTLKQNGMQKMLRGETDMEQVRAVCA
jgi:type II secretory ATPase GspE/PulE/Tfp pilus assembly ATPase PilB-like protein